MDDIDSIKNCKSCGFSGAGNYCSKCGQPFYVKRITLSGLLYDIFHLLTKFERGFGYTLKQLIIAPGHTQRAYIEGDRARHQKPFSLFFICATFSAITRYWILNAFIQYYHLNNTADFTEAAFFREYMVFLYIALIPLYTLIVCIFFINQDITMLKQA